jgi:predicted acylesterase/phospholipase RssA
MKETAPERYCDIVMKGGITSGVVYPLAIVELADEFRFKNIGGTSAGAIAAAVTAAAEYQRVTKNSAAGFRRLEELPNFLGGKTGNEPNLLNLFPPTRPTRALFNLAMAFTGDRKWWRKIIPVLSRLLTLSWLWTLAMFLPVLLVIGYLSYEWKALSSRGVAGLVLIAALLLGAGLLGLVIRTIMRAGVLLSDNKFGFSTGMKPDDRKLLGVTDWLHQELQLAAGRAIGDAPMTFGDLWTAGGDQTAEKCRKDAESRSIDLKMITTALTHGRPYQLPFEDQRFAFRKSDLEAYFPPTVIAHLCEKGDKVKDGPFDDLYHVPHGEDLPIVVATRMSLSFPILFTLVPLYAKDFTMKPEEEDAPWKRTWFIDGGLSSNFPLNLFDSLVPRWPTFGINLGSPHEAHPIDKVKQCNNIWMVANNRSGRQNRWIPFPATGWPALTAYIAAMLDTIRNWRDNTQMGAPGFLDRVVHIRLAKDEGGLNLDMDDDRVTRLTERGRFAGQRLRERFGTKGAGVPPLNWNSHRWTRYKIAMTVLQKAMRSFDAAFEWTDPSYPNYKTLVEREKDENPETDYWWYSKEKRIAYQDLTQKFAALAAQVRDAPDFDEERPTGKPRLSITPRL